MQSAVKTVRQGGRNVKSAVKGLKNKMPKTGSRASSINTADNSSARYSCGSVTPVSSSSSSSSREEPREPPPVLPLDLLTEMESLFKNSNRRDSFPGATRGSEISLPEKAKTLSPCVPPRLADRPKVPLRYPIVSTRTLIDISDAPAPPPRAAPPIPNTNVQFVSNITKNDENNSSGSTFHTSVIRFVDGKDKAKLKLTMSTHQRKLAPRVPHNGSTLEPPASVGSRPPDGRVVRACPLPLDTIALQESCGSDTDLIKLDDSPNVEDFDPLKYRDSNERTKSSADSALLHEYGLDFSQFGLLSYKAGTSSQPDTSAAVPKGWTTFN